MIVKKRENSVCRLVIEVANFRGRTVEAEVYVCNNRDGEREVDITLYEFDVGIVRSIELTFTQLDELVDLIKGELK